MCAVLCCAVLCCAVLCCAVLCCAVLCRVDIGMLHDELQSIGDMMQQEVTVSEHYVLFSECDHCVTAYAG
jgi:hypothetical protein